MAGILWILIAHLLVESVFITGALSRQKALAAHRIVHQLTSRLGPRHLPATGEPHTWQPYAKHGIVVALTVYAALWIQIGGTSPWTAALCALTATALHLGVDLVKHTAAQRPLISPLARLFGRFDEGLYRLLALAFFQAVHIAALVWVVGLFFPPRYPWGALVWYARHHLLGPAPVPEADRFAYVLLLVLTGTFGAGAFIRHIVRSFYPEQADEDGPVPPQAAAETAATAPPGERAALESARFHRTGFPPQRWSPAGTGRWIGILERLMIILLVARGVWSGIAFIFTAKSLARYRQLDDREFAEYYIIGTLISTLIGMAFGLLVARALATI